MFPDPVPGEDEHYLPFEKVYSTPTTEVDRPSSFKRSKKQKTLPFVASIQHARNVNPMIQCVECGMWRLIYSKKKLTSQAKKGLEKSLTTLISAVEQAHLISTYLMNSAMLQCSLQSS